METERTVIAWGRIADICLIFGVPIGAAWLNEQERARKADLEASQPPASVSPIDPSQTYLGAPAFPQDRAPQPYPQTLRGSYCTDDCSGHEAGAEWADDNEINDPEECDGNSNSFIEGCQDRAEERAQELEDMASTDEAG